MCVCYLHVSRGLRNVVFYSLMVMICNWPCGFSSAGDCMCGVLRFISSRTRIAIERTCGRQNVMLQGPQTRFEEEVTKLRFVRASWRTRGEGGAEAGAKLQFSILHPLVTVVCPGRATKERTSLLGLGLPAYMAAHRVWCVF